MNVVRNATSLDVPIPICFCGHPNDVSYCNELEVHFSLMTRQRKVLIHQSHKVLAGMVQKEEIESYMASARIIVLFISALFFHECWDIVKRAMDLSDEGRVRIVPILVSHVDYEATPLKKLQALPRRKKPLAQIKGHPDRDEVYVEVVQAIREVIQDLQACNNNKEDESIKEGTDEQPRLDDPASYKARGDRFFQLQQYDQALAAYDQAISLDPDFADAYRAKAEVHRALASLAYKMLKQLSEQSSEETGSLDDTQEGLGR